MAELDRVTQADDDAFLMMQAFTLGQHNPAIWIKYVKAWEAEVERRINDRFGLDPGAPDVGPDG